MARKFDRYMVDVNVGTNRKLRRLSVAERLCHLAGVLPVAAQAPIRGRLLVGDQNAEARDFAELAGVSIRVASSAIAKLREVGIVVRDEENECEMVHDWADWNPEPKSDPTAAERMRRYRERRGLRNVTPVTDRNAVTDTPGREGKGKEENTPQPPDGDEGGRTSSRKPPRPPAPDSLPDDLPEPLRVVAPFVVDSLRRLAEAKGAKDVTLAAVGRALAAYPEHDHRRIVGDVEHYWVHGDGQTSIVRDAVLTYRNRLGRVPAGKTAALRAVPAVESSAAVVARMNGGAA